MTPRALRLARFKKAPDNFGCTPRPPQSVNRAGDRSVGQFRAPSSDDSYPALRLGGVPCVPAA
jgi:hypothetical protein